SVFLREDNEKTMLDAIQRLYRSGTRFDRSYLAAVLSGEKSIESWREEIDQGSRSAKSALELVLPYYAVQLVAIEESALTEWDLRFLEMVGQHIADSRLHSLEVTLGLDVNDE